MGSASHRPTVRRLTGNVRRLEQTNRPNGHMVKESDRGIEASDVIPMFPTLLWKILLKPELRDALDTTILAMLHGEGCDLPGLEPGRGWQSDQTLHEREGLHELVACVNHVTSGILRFLRIG